MWGVAAAAASGEESMVKLLSECGTEVNIQLQDGVMVVRYQQQ